ncbi:TetR/AcrR family transcriptional regulator [Streptomyces sp. PLAI1-29]|uniref:TetR/AcrR family transcriptional regulator n=2 Tax=Streptomyces zingiberis TaxID=2053010 RepID=A0ABX1BWE3_9ACTN|nr:TetR/AcrR family transcriptional regulator [Streptomyces zingiberis]
MRADARRNHERLLTVARAAFTEHGTDTSLEEVARRAGVGVGTLYRHFPNRRALIGAVFHGEVEALADRARELLEAEEPCAALLDWLRALIDHSVTYRGLSRALMTASTAADCELSSCAVPVRAAGGELLARAQRAGATRAEVEIGDLIRLTNAIAIAVEESPGDPGLADRLLTLTLHGLRADPGACAPGPAGR